MAARATKLDTRRSGTGMAGGPTVRAAIDSFLDSPKVKGNPNTLRAYTKVLDRAAEVLGPERALSDVADDELADALNRTVGHGEAGDLEPQPCCGQLLADLVRQQAALDHADGARGLRTATREQRRHQSCVPLAH